MDVFFNEKYGKLYENTEKGECVAYDFECEYGKIRNIFIKREIPYKIDGESYFDIITPYGYGGPTIIEASNEEKLIEAYFSDFEKYCKNEKIVCAFCRFHLFDNVKIREKFDGEAINISDNVVRFFDKSLDEIYMEFDHKVRKNVKKAQSFGLSCVIDEVGEYLDDFLAIYYDTMDRNNAKDYYYFDKGYFENIVKNLPENHIFFHVMLDNKVISTELVLYGDDYAYSFLGGTFADYYSYRPNDFLKYEIIKWCSQTGKKAFILGGGYTKDDGIYRYKKAFAPNGDVPFYIGKRIFDANAYEKLCEIRKAFGNYDENTGFFPKYRS